MFILLHHRNTEEPLHVDPDLIAAIRENGFQGKYDSPPADILIHGMWIEVKESFDRIQQLWEEAEGALR